MASRDPMESPQLGAWHMEMDHRFSQTVVDLGVCGFSPIYGRMMPYLHDVDLEEHYFVQGPSQRKAEAIQHFAKLGETKSLLTSL